MTLSTYVYLQDPVSKDEVFEFCKGLLNDPPLGYEIAVSDEHWKWDGDDGTCHHYCDKNRTGCWRVFNAAPLSASGWDEWPEEIKRENAAPRDLTFVVADNTAYKQEVLERLREEARELGYALIEIEEIE